jgi:hypothetical protein
MPCNVFLAPRPQNGCTPSGAAQNMMEQAKASNLYILGASYAGTSLVTSTARALERAPSAGSPPRHSDRPGEGIGLDGAASYGEPRFLREFFAGRFRPGPRLLTIKVHER